MPAITPGNVLVTGANGYIALWIVKAFLERGYSVRGTVRSEAKVSHLKELFKTYGDQLEIIIVEDITKAREGAFDEAVKDVDAVVHTASPYFIHLGDPQDLIVPALEGTTSILDSTLKFGTQVKRFIHLSTCGAVLEALPHPKQFNEENWNNRSVREVEEKGIKANGIDKYRTSKVYAERVAWKFLEEHKGELNWDFAALNPPMVYGPTLQDVRSPEMLGTSMRQWYDSVLEQKGLDANALATIGQCYVDVRDLALSHIYVLEREEAGGHRIIICAGAYIWQDFVNAARKFNDGIPPGNQSYKPEEAVHMIQYDTGKSVRVLGMRYRSIEETTRDILENLNAKGLWPKH